MMSKGNMNDSAIKCAETDDVNWFLWCVLSVRSCVCGEKRFAATDFHRTCHIVAARRHFPIRLFIWCMFFCFCFFFICVRTAPADWMMRWATKCIFNVYQSPVVHPINIRHEIGYARYRMLGVAFIAFVSVCGQKHSDCESVDDFYRKIKLKHISWAERQLEVTRFTSIAPNFSKRSSIEFWIFSRNFDWFRSWAARGRNRFMNKN